MIYVKKIGKWYVYVSEYNGTWIAQTLEQGNDGQPIGDKETMKKLEANTLPLLEELIKRQNSDDRHFKPIDVIRISDGLVGRITSRVAGQEGLVYFTWKASPTDKANRDSVRLVYSRGWGNQVEYSLVNATPENLIILETIKRKVGEVGRLEKQIGELRKTFKDPITEESIEKEGA